MVVDILQFDDWCRPSCSAVDFPCYGEKAEKKEQRCLRYALMTSVLLGIIFFVVGYIFAKPLIRVFSDQDADLIAISVTCMRYYSPAYFIMGIGIPLGIYFQAIEKPH